MHPAGKKYLMETQHIEWKSHQMKPSRFIFDFLILYFINILFHLLLIKYRKYF